MNRLAWFSAGLLLGLLWERRPCPAEEVEITAEDLVSQYVFNRKLHYRSRPVSKGSPLVPR